MTRSKYLFSHTLLVSKSLSCAFNPRPFIYKLNSHPLSIPNPNAMADDRNPSQTKPSPLSTTTADKVFDRFDSNGDGKISPSELAHVVRSLGSPVSDTELTAMIQEMDKNNDGFVDKAEFAQFSSVPPSDNAEVDAELKDAFDMYDLNGNGVISSKELHLVMGKLGEKCSVEDCARMIGSVDRDGDGCVNFDEFKRMMNKGGEGSRN